MFLQSERVFNYSVATLTRTIPVKGEVRSEINRGMSFMQAPVRRATFQNIPAAAALTPLAWGQG